MDDGSHSEDDEEEETSSRPAPRARLQGQSYVRPSAARGSTQAVHQAFGSQNLEEPAAPGATSRRRRRRQDNIDRYRRHHHQPS
jgi:hypothetical protein